jgi:hypothetical protein
MAIRQTLFQNSFGNQFILVLVRLRVFSFNNVFNCMYSFFLCQWYCSLTSEKRSHFAIFEHCIWKEIRSSCSDRQDEHIMLTLLSSILFQKFLFIRTVLFSFSRSWKFPSRKPLHTASSVTYLGKSFFVFWSLNSDDKSRLIKTAFGIDHASKDFLTFDELIWCEIVWFDQYRTNFFLNSRPFRARKDLRHRFVMLFFSFITWVLKVWRVFICGRILWYGFIAWSGIGLLISSIQACILYLASQRSNVSLVSFFFRDLIIFNSIFFLFIYLSKNSWTHCQELSALEFEYCYYRNGPWQVDLLRHEHNNLLWLSNIRTYLVPLWILQSLIFIW